jgi:hypothetical protein
MLKELNHKESEGAYVAPARISSIILDFVNVDKTVK